MNRKNWLIPVFVFGIGLLMPFSSFAEGWEQLGSNWIYKDENGQRVTREWKKGADGKYRWLDSAGDMARDQWVDLDRYYVDEDGIYVDGGWKKIKEHWYYFSDHGRVIKDGWEKISNKWYYFDEEGRMLTGWIKDNMYYSGEDGVMYTGWHKLLPPNEDGEEREGARPAPFDNGDDDNKRWYYFANNGKKFIPKLRDGAEYGEGKIEGKKYCFSEDGALTTGWINLEGTDADSATIKDFRYYNEDGTLRKGWYSIEPPENIMESYYNNVEWFYFDNSGEPKASEGERLKSSDIVKINGRQYLFNRRGNPVYGLQKVYLNDDSYTAYYFGTQQQSNIQKGKMRLKEIGDSDVTYYFTESTGRGYTGVKDSYLYYMGRLQKADKGTRYQVISIPNESGNGFTNYVVNTSGKVSKNKKVKDGDKVEYKTNSRGVLIELDDSTDGIGGVFINPIEPEFAEN